MKTTDAIKYWEAAFDKSCRNNSYQSSGKIEYEDAVWTALEALRAQAGLEDTEPLQQSEAIDTEPLHNPDKPRLAELLGVEVGQKWRVVCPEEGIDSAEVWLNKKGHLAGRTFGAGSAILCAAINHPECIVRVPKLTEAELAICKAIGAKYVTRNGDGCYVFLWREKPEHKEFFGDAAFYSPKGSPSLICSIEPSIFPSVRPGRCICVEEAEPAIF